MSLLFAGQAWAADKYWNPTDGTNWNTAANWSPSGLPGTADIAIFNSDTNNTGCVINTNISVAGILITNYTGTVTQGLDRTVTIGASEYRQYSGVFEGGNTNFTTPVFTLAGGTFTAPSNTMTIANTLSTSHAIFTYTAGTFNHNNGTLRIRSWFFGDGHTHTIDLNGGSLAVNHLTYTGGNYYPNRSVFYALGSAADTFIVNGDLVLEADTGSHASAAVIANTGTIQAEGHVTVNAGLFGGTTALDLVGANEQTVTQTGGTAPTGNWTIDKSGGTATLASDIALSGASQDLIWESGALDVVTNTLSVGRNLVVTNDVTTLKWAYDNIDDGLISATAIVLDVAQNLVATWAGAGSPEEGTFNVMTWTSATGPGTPDISVSGLPSGYRGLVQYSEGGKYIRLAVSQEASGGGEAFLVPNSLLVPNRLLVNEVSP